MKQTSLFDVPVPRFDGASFEVTKDSDRLGCQLAAVRDFMLVSGWRTLAEIEGATGYPQASISARLRDLRKEKFGAFTIERRRRHQGTFEYRMVIAKQGAA